MTPSLPALRAFDAAARKGSFRAAGEHLSVTPTAISHHIRGLEDQLGVRLFDRIGRDVALTEDGKRLAAATSQAFGLLDEAVHGLRRNARRVVRLMAGPIFTARWLMPRISDLWEDHPEIELEVLPAYRPTAPDRSNADIVVRWARLQEMPGAAARLLALNPVAIASSEFSERHGPILSPVQLLGLPLLHQRDHWGWLDWFAAMGVEVPTPLRGPVFEDANVLLRGASEGLGAVVGWLPLIDQDLAEGRVVRLFDEDITPTHGYFVELAPGKPASREARLVLDWLVSRTGPGSMAMG